MTEPVPANRTSLRGLLALVRAMLRPLVRRIRAMHAGIRLQRSLRKRIHEQAEDLRIVVGASGTGWSGWVSTEYPVFDVSDASSVRKFLRPGSVAVFLAEHVWEHLTPAQAAAAVSNCHELLRPGGRLRIAVPDALHPDPAYREYARPGGTGEGSDDHKVFYTFATLTNLLEAAGFEVRLLEWFDKDGKFNFNHWDPADGLIVRSTRYDDRNRQNPTTYTSLIVDGIKR